MEVGNNPQGCQLFPNSSESSLIRVTFCGVAKVEMSNVLVFFGF